MRKILYGILGCLLLIAMFLGIQRLTDTQTLTWDESVTAKQFSENIYSIKETDFRVYDGALYTPEDFAAYGTELSSGAAPAAPPRCSSAPSTPPAPGTTPGPWQSAPRRTAPIPSMSTPPAPMSTM